MKHILNHFQWKDGIHYEILIYDDKKETLVRKVKKISNKARKKK